MPAISNYDTIKLYPERYQHSGYGTKPYEGRLCTMAILPDSGSTVPGSSLCFVGSRFGYLTVIDVGHTRTVGPKMRRCRFVLVRCDCGTEKWLRWDTIRSGHSNSCGCRSLELLRKNSIEHGDCETPLYKRWQGMMRRCRDVNDPNYGGRGIAVCVEWLDYPAFKQWALSNGYAQNLELDRVDTNKGYSPENCRFITHKENTHNTRRNNIVTAWGETKILVGWVKDPRCQVTQAQLSRRLAKGLSPEEAIGNPPQNQNRRGKEVAARGGAKPTEGTDVCLT